MAGTMLLDPEVARRARAGDAAAIEALVGALERPIYTLALRMLLDPADAEDATQEALIKVLVGLPSFEGRSKLSTWAWTVASRAILDERRARARRPQLTFDAVAADLADGLDLEAPDRPEDRVLVAQVKVGCGRAMLQCLDGDHRLAYVLGEILEMDASEAAEIAGVTPEAHRKRLSRARARLSEALGEVCGLVEPTAACRCHRRLPRARALGRVREDATDPGLDVAALTAWVRELDDLASRVGAFYGADPEESPPAARRAELRRAAAALATGP